MFLNETYDLLNAHKHSNESHGQFEVNHSHYDHLGPLLFWSLNDESTLSQHSLAEEIAHVAQFCFGLFGLLLNIFMLATVFSSETLYQQRSFCLNVSLIVSDLLVCGGVLLLDPILFANHHNEHHTERPSLWHCQVWASFSSLACTTLSLNIPAIAVDRYVAISRPLHYEWTMTSCTMACLVSAVWLVASVVSSVPFFLNIENAWADSAEHEDHRAHTGHPLALCRLRLHDHVVITVMAVVIFMPAVTLVVIYARIYKVSMLQRKSVVCHHMLGRLIELSATELKPPDECPPADDLPWDTDSSLSLAAEQLNRYAGSCVDLVNCRRSLDDDGFYHQFSEGDLMVQTYLQKHGSSTHHLNKSSHLSVTSCPGSPGSIGSSRLPLAPPSSPLPTSIRVEHSQKVSFDLGSPGTSEPMDERSETRCRCCSKVKRFSMFFTLCCYRPNTADKATRVLSLIVGTYLVCWLPLGFASMASIAWPGSVGKTASDVVLWMAYSTSCLNPVIYSMYNRPLLQAMTALFMGREWVAKRYYERRQFSGTLMRTYSYTLRQSI